MPASFWVKQWFLEVMTPIFVSLQTSPWPRMAISLYPTGKDCFIRYLLFEPPHQKTNNLHMRKQRRISANTRNTFKKIIVED